MPWNNGYERALFEKEQKRLAEEYRAAGMTEEDIHIMYLFDLDTFNNNRRHREHTQQFPENVFGDVDEGTSPLNDKFLIEMSTTLEQSEYKERYWWIEDIDNPELSRKIKELSEEDIRLITLLVYEKYTQKEVAELLGITQGAVSMRYTKLKKILGIFQKR